MAHEYDNLEKLKHIKWITFDCYGTLIDWETGIVETLEPLFKRSHKAFHPSEILKTYARLEKEAESGPYRPYRAVLREVMIHFARTYDLYLAPGEECLLEEHLPSWKAFPDVPFALGQLTTHFLVGVLSNIDTDLIHESFRQFDTFPTLILTSEQVRYYKPHPVFFETFMKETGVKPGTILHCAQSLYHDIKPASNLGWVTCHVARPHPWGAPATPSAQVKPDFTVENLRELLDLLQKAGLFTV